MKNFLFSKSLKKQFSGTVVRMGKNNLGFSLVELIIVIAIMAILAAVAIPVFSMYIDKTKVANDKQKVNDILYAINLAGQSAQYPVDIPQVSDDGLQVPVGFIILTNTGEPIIFGNDGTVVESGDSFIVTPGEKGELISEMMTDIIGTKFNSEYKLQDENWTGTTISTLYSNTTELFSSVKTLSELLVLSGQTDCESGEEVVAMVARNIVGHYDLEGFKDAWVGVSSDEHTFGLSTYGQETYIAVRRAYNESVAEYIETTTAAKHVSAKTYSYSGGITIPVVNIGAYRNCSEQTNVEQNCVDHTALIKKYGEVQIGELVVSDVIYYSVFDSDSVGYEKKSSYYVPKAGVLPDNVQTCSLCKQGVTNYPTSAAAKNDADAFYKTMKTIAAGADRGWTEWDQYEGYVNSFSNLYSGIDIIQSSLDAKETSYVILTVYQSGDGLLYGECNTPGVLDE